MSERTLYYFAIGGTGALSVEPLLHLCAAGVGPDRLGIILIDPDAANPALERALALIERYQNVRKDFGSPAEGFFRTELIRTQRQQSVWSPLGSGNDHIQGQNTLESYVQRALMEGESRDALHLFETLFSPAQRREKLEEGFRGNPAIGSIMMHGLKDAPLFRELMNSAKSDTDARFFACGSIFGGTGASALPVVAKLLTDAGIDRLRIGAALVTPYYALGVPSDDEERDGRLKPDSEKFLSATSAALPTYTRGHTRYGSLYVIGDEQSLSKPRKQYSAGGASQLNDPHYVEFFAALAALSFAREGSEGMHYASVGDAEPTWSDLMLPESEGRQLRAFIIASSFFLQYFGASRSPADEQRIQAELEKIPFLQDIQLTPSFVRTDARQLNNLGEYFEAVWGWLWATSHNYQALRLVSFATPSAREFHIPTTYASRDLRASHLPRVEQSLSGFNTRRRRGIFKRGDPDRLDSLAEMFRWYHNSANPGLNGLPGLLHHLHVGTDAFISDFYSPGMTNASVAS
jgi:hypothetical protein